MIKCSKKYRTLLIIEEKIIIFYNYKEMSTKEGQLQENESIMVRELTDTLFAVFRWQKRILITYK